MNILQILLTTLGVIKGTDERMDAKYTAILAKQLESVKVKTYDIVYPKLKARLFIPVDNSADTGAETVTYRQWDAFGMAQIIANYADDIPLVDALCEEFTQKIQSLGLGYQYSIQDLRRSAMSGAQLDQRRARQCRRGVEQSIENIAANGHTAGGLTGIANNSNVTLVSPTTGTWSSATGAQMVADMMKLTSAMVIANLETFEPTDILLDIASYQRFSTTRISTTGDTGKTALEAFKESDPYGVNVSSWNKLALADAAGTGPRAICYHKSPDVLTLEIPQEFEIFPPQQDNLAFKVPAHARTGGVIMYYPIGASYMDGL